jgi:hypothetical protein
VGGCACARVCECLYSTRVSVSRVLVSAVEYEGGIVVRYNDGESSELVNHGNGLWLSSKISSSSRSN